MQLADAMSAGAIAIQIPRRFLSTLNENGSWRPLSHQISDRQIFWHAEQRDGANAPPRNTHDGITGTARDVFSEEPMLYSLPPTSRITCNTLVQVFRSSNKIVIAVTLLQLIYTAFKVYIQYGLLIRDRGLSTPFLVAIPYLYMSFVNLIANLVQGCYTHVTTIEPRLALSVATPTVPDPDVIPMADHAVGEVRSTEGLFREQNETRLHGEGHSDGPTIELSSVVDQSSAPTMATPVAIRPDLATEFGEWLQTNFPQIHIEEHPFLPRIAFFLHYTLSLAVILIWIGLLTSFHPGAGSSQIYFLLAIILDPLLHLLLALVQTRHEWKKYTCGLGVIWAIKSIVWGFNLWGCFVAGKELYRIYDEQ